MVMKLRVKQAKLKLLLFERDMTQEQLGREAGYTISLISKLVTGAFVPTEKQQERIAKVFNLPVEKVFQLGRGR
jgi:transcriptional regulator with XRE-family HTH domain